MPVDAKLARTTLARLRKGSGLTMRGAAALVEYTGAAWSLWESGQRAVPRAVLERFAARTGQLTLLRALLGVPDTRALLGAYRSACAAEGSAYGDPEGDEAAAEADKLEAEILARLRDDVA